MFEAKKSERFQQALRSYVATRPRATDADVKGLEELEFEKLRAARLTTHKDDLRANGVPRFHNGEGNAGPRPLLARLQAEGRNRFLEKRSRGMWDNDMLCALQEKVLEHSDPTDHTLSFAAFEKVRKAFYAEYPALPTVDIYGMPVVDAVLFLRLQAMERSSRVSMANLIHAVMREVFVYQTRLDLYSVESDNNGSLAESDLETFITDAIPICGPLSSMPASMIPFYVCTAMRRFAHFLKPLRSGKVATGLVMASVPMEEFVEVVMAKDAESVVHNWFGMSYSMLVYDKYAKLDTNHDGMLSLSELRSYKKGSPPLEDPGIDGTFTDIFVSRVFEVTNTYSGLMDYKKFVDFALLVETLPAHPNLELMWRIFDLHDAGYLSPLVVNLFVREVRDKLAILNMVSTTLENLVIEIMDVVGCGSKLRLTKQEFFASRNAGLFCSLLIDYHALVLYEQREAQIAQQIAAQQSQVNH